MHLPLLLILLIVAVGDATAQVERRTANEGNLVMEGVPEIPADWAERLNRYQNVRSASFADWQPEGRGIYIATRFAEVNQIHRVDQAGGARHQLTFLPEPVGSINRQHDGPLLTFTMDAGGSELDQIFLFDPARSEHRMLSDGESRNGVVAWSHDGNRIAYQSTRRNGRSNDIWVMAVAAPQEARLVLEAPDGAWWGPAEFSPDDTRLLVQQYTSVADSAIHELDLDSGELRRLVGDPEAPSANLAGGYDAAGTGFYFTTDASGEFTVLAHARNDGSKVTPITADIPWDVDSFAISRDGRRAAFEVNENGLSRLYLLDPASHRYRAVDGIPPGLLGGLTFSPDGRRLAMTLNSARTPSDSFVLGLGDSPLVAGELERWTWSEVGGLDTSQFVEPRLISYPTFDQVDGRPRQIPAYLYLPPGEGPFPVVVAIHGGPESQYRPSFSSTFQFWLNELGIAVIAPNVRGSAGYGKSYLTLDNAMRREDSVRDIGALLDWIGQQPQLDTDRVAVYGGSYGGYMVLASAVHYSDRLKAAVDVVGISNFVTFLENTEDYRRDLRRVEYGDERDPAMRAHLEKISPLNSVDRIQIPLFVIQGQNDPRVPVTEAEQMVAALRERNQPVWYMNALNEGHGYARKENRDIYLQAVGLFLREFLVEGR